MAYYTNLPLLSAGGLSFGQKPVETEAGLGSSMKRINRPQQMAEFEILLQVDVLPSPHAHLQRAGNTWR